MIAAATQAAFDAVREMTRRVAGIRLDPSQSYLFEPRLAPVAEQHGFRSPIELVLAAGAQRRPDL
jgi:hypothetical protein